MKQEVTANDLLKSLNEQGRVALYINFDVDKATIRPDSEATIAEIVVLLANTPALSVSIEGHTDNTGNSQYNKALSEQRAKAVTDAIAQQGIERNRLTSVRLGTGRADRRQRHRGRSREEPAGGAGEEILVKGSAVASRPTRRTCYVETPHCLEFGGNSTGFRCHGKPSGRARSCCIAVRGKGIHLYLGGYA